MSREREREREIKEKNEKKKSTTTQQQNYSTHSDENDDFLSPTTKLVEREREKFKKIKIPHLISSSPTHLITPYIFFLKNATSSREHCW